MASGSPAQQKTVERVMHEFKHGELEAAGGRKVKSRKQAIAIALHEAGESNRESPAKNRETLKATKAMERAGRTGRAAAESGPGATKAGLYVRAQKAGIPGRSRMTKAELQRALATSG